MKETEEQILNIISMILEPESKNTGRSEIYKIEKQLRNLTLGDSSREFINHPSLAAFILEKLDGNKYSIYNRYIQLWFAIEKYMLSNGDKDSLNQVEEILKKYLEENDITPENNARGISMLPGDIANKKFMKDLFILNDKNLSELFLNYFPAPKSKIFSGHIVPEIISKREDESLKSVKSVLERNDNKISSVEEKIIKAQRIFRAKKKKKEDLARISYHYGVTTLDAKKLHDNANTPYIPKCNPELAMRIMQAAKKVELFSTVKHLTASSALESIFNDGLHGRRNMLQFYMDYRPAALSFFDSLNGDSNVVCLGANAIDPSARHGIELEFDVKKISEDNPCIFYKQRDLGFDLKKIRNVKIGDINLSFSHTERIGDVRDADLERKSSLQLFDRNKNLYAFSEITKALLIADNLEKMHQILTLNFFRFIDELTDFKSNKNIINSEKIYSELSNLNDESLIETLQNIGMNMTDTMEYNFYGAYLIDFSALLNIVDTNQGYTLNLAHFIDELNEGAIEKLQEAQKNIPAIFESYRFIDYLLSVTNHEEVVEVLQKQRKLCTLPPWESVEADGKPHI